MAFHNMARGVNVYRAGPKGDATRAHDEMKVRVNVDNHQRGPQADREELPPLRFGFAPTGEADGGKN